MNDLGHRDTGVFVTVYYGANERDFSAARVRARSRSRSRTHFFFFLNNYTGIISETISKLHPLVCMFFF